MEKVSEEASSKFQVQGQQAGKWLLLARGGSEGACGNMGWEMYLGIYERCYASEDGHSGK